MVKTVCPVYALGLTVIVAVYGAFPPEKVVVSTPVGMQFIVLRVELEAIDGVVYVPGTVTVVLMFVTVQPPEAVQNALKCTSYVPATAVE